MIARPSPPRGFAPGPQGFILIAVLWITAVLSILALGYAASSRLKGLTARNFQLLEQEYFMLQSGLAKGYHEYQKYQSNKKLFAQQEELEAVGGEEIELWYPRQESFPVSVGDTEVWVQLINASGRFNANELDAGQWRKVLTWCGVSDEAEITSITNSILDWIDPDSNHRIEGAENDYYRSLDRPYICKNGPLESIEELLLIRGVSQELFAGSPASPGLRDFLTLYGESLQLDVNSAPVQAFALVEGLPEDVVQEIVELRREKPIQNMSELSEIVPIEYYDRLTAAFAATKVTHLTIRVTKSQDTSAPAASLQRTYQVDE